MPHRPPSGKPWGILVVDADLVTLRALLTLLRTSGYSTSGAVHLKSAMSLASVVPFDLLIADVPPRSDASLQLIRVARGEHPAMAVIAMTAFRDTAVEEECMRLGVPCLRKPLNPQHLLRIVAEKVLGELSDQRRWSRKHVTGGFPARVGATQAKVINMSYGGLSLEMPAAPKSELRQPLEVRVLPFGLSLTAELVWGSLVKSSGSWACGAALLETDVRRVSTWRTVVDALPR